MLSVALVAIDVTILATAVPSLVSDLGGFSQFPWLFSIYLLAQAVSVPIYGKLSDLFGRKPVMLIGITLFVLGSALCGAAWSMPALIVFRAIQGLGAGAVLPMSMTIIGDLYTLEERARVQGYVASVWGIASVVGPTLGGVFSDYLSWRWIFFVNIPIGIAAATMLWRRFDERVERKKHRIDYAGAVLLAVGGSLLVLGPARGWHPVGLGLDRPASACFVAAAVLLVLFGLVERRATEPILPLWIFGHRILNGTNAASLVVGVLLIGLVSYVPLYAQGVLGSSALVGGFAVATMTVGWPISAALSGRLYMRIGFRDTGFIGAALLLLGTGLLLTVGADSTVLHLAVAVLLRRPRPRPHRVADAGGRPVVGGMGDPGRRHRHQHVRALGGQCRGHRRLRCGGERRSRQSRRGRQRQPGAGAGTDALAGPPRRLRRFGHRGRGHAAWPSAIVPRRTNFQAEQAAKPITSRA